MNNQIKMPTQRPFFANFLAAFRAQSSPSFNAVTSPSSTGAAMSSSGSTSTTTTTTHLTTTASGNPSHSSATGSTPRSISTKATSFHPGPPPVRSPSPEAITYNHNSSPTAQTSSLSRSPNTTSASHYVGMAMSPSSTGASTPPFSRGRQRRGSDSSSSSGGTNSGFKDILGTEKWYIGGRTPSGEEKFYRLGMVTSPGMAFGGAAGGSGKRVKSLDRLSL